MIIFNGSAIQRPREIIDILDIRIEDIAGRAGPSPKFDIISRVISR